VAIYETGGYEVRESGIEKVKTAIKEFVNYVQGNEPGTEMYLAWQEKHQPTRFLHFFIFKDEEARQLHGQSEAVRRFESAYSSELVEGVAFTEYEIVAGKLPHTQRRPPNGKLSPTR